MLIRTVSIATSFPVSLFPETLGTRLFPCSYSVRLYMYFSGTVSRVISLPQFYVEITVT